ncbi:MAG: SPOR domain-containing protein [Thermodesulfobacteriota bacterium]
MARASRRVSGHTPETESPNRKTKPERNRYTVQVGAYSNPSVAVQWAERWRKKGFDAVLKPVATSEGKVVYRLHVGAFHSCEQADQLVSRLKHKGVAAVRRRVGN